MMKILLISIFRVMVGMRIAQSPLRTEVSVEQYVKKPPPSTK
jgi:hypothetical protein